MFEKSESVYHGRIPSNLPAMDKVIGLTYTYPRVVHQLTSKVELTSFAKKPASIVTLGLWDTGASTSMITAAAADQLGLQVKGRTKIRSVRNSSRVNVYELVLTLGKGEENVSFPLIVTECGALDDDGSIGFLIGMDVISMGDFSLSNHGGKTTLSFRVPSMGGEDYAKEPKGAIPVLSTPESQGYL